MTDNNPFPFIPEAVTTETEQTTTELALFSEYDFDFDTAQLKLKDGVNYKVFGNDALKIWIWKTLNPRTSRFNYRAYSTNYGNELNLILGRYAEEKVLNSEIERIISDALLVNPYIELLNGWNFEKNGASMEVTFNCLTIYGEISHSLEIIT